MKEIDLSQTKIGDKFRTRNGEVATYKGTDGRIAKSRSDYYVCACSDDAKITYFKNGALLLDEEHSYDLVEQVFDDEKYTTDLERIDAMNQALKEFSEKAAEREKDLQRRQEVVELADRIFFSERGSAYSFKECIEVAEHSVNMINQYLKEGKL
jgi:hypothetical protein